ncbi:hypothetical protein BC835DRAFT_1285314 [Cytidiella melzeri]|nr:hypothetical protein BC835DRAFT_1285314 [Cytidiella melzeri]
MRDGGNTGIGLAYLPTELYNAIIAHLEEGSKDYLEFRCSLLALSRAIPRAPLPLDALFRRIILQTPRQAQNLFLRLRKDASSARLVQVFKYECFEADADIIVNVLKLLQSVTDLTIFMGPNFAPEHLENLFASPRTNLKSLSLRFRPYVQRATYLQFMKGVYFDSTLTYLSAWPRSSLPQLSVVQDPLDPSIAPAGKFAQPIVFFRLDSTLSEFSASAFSASLASMRFRIPSRHIMPYLHKHERSFPRIGFLDIATCSASAGDLEALLVDLKGIHTLILDGCPIVSQRADALETAGAEALAQWNSLGKTFALVGAKRARQREKQMKVWIEQQENSHTNRRGGGAQQGGSKKAKKGRKGVANATFLIREPAQETGSKSTSCIPLRKPGNFRITPSPSPLRSLAITAPMVSVRKNDFKEKYAAVKKEFEAGWVSGVRQLTVTRDRMKTTWINGATRVLVEGPVRVKPTSNAEDKHDDAALSDSGNESIPSSSDSRSPSLSSSKEERRRLEFKTQELECPVLCLAGPEKGEFHPDGCPHVMAWKLWDDGI